MANRHSEESLDFYKDLPAFDDFSGIAEDRNFFPVPENWNLILTDIKGSTKAISEGGYKKVNLMGAACITSVMNLLKNSDFPFVFGGDGATMLLPPSFLDAAIEELRRLQSLAQTQFQLTLRIGVVDLKSLYDQGSSLQIGKYQLSPGNVLAQFRGGALTLAEDLLKNEQPGILILKPVDRTESPNLAGLSCRLNPLRSRHGQMLTLLCKPQGAQDSQDLLARFLTELNAMLKQDLKSLNPVNLANTQWKWIPDAIADEIKISGHFAKGLRWLKVIFQNLIVNGSLKLGYSLGPFEPQKYKAELVTNSDFKKFDETLRMVIDCNADQARQIEDLLKQLHQEGRIFYGLHKSDSALMTCMVFSASKSQHVHFIDGANGGYALAAVGMKEQMKQRMK